MVFLLVVVALVGIAVRVEEANHHIIIPLRLTAVAVVAVVVRVPAQVITLVVVVAAWDY
jgi:hypothetical protein